MCFVIVVVGFYVGASALAFWLLPHWIAATLVSVVGIALLLVYLKIRRFIKKIKTKLGGLTPEEKICSLAANEPFSGHGFSFTFPVACEVSQTHFREVEALVLKPKFDFPNAPRDTLLVVSTFPPAELKPKINDTLEKVFAQVEGLAAEPSPVTVGNLQGERRAFTTTKDGKDVRGEAVYLGDENGSIVWVAIASAENFEALAGKYRELAVLIRRTETPQPAPNPS